MRSYLTKVALLAALYFFAGKLGLALAVPPGYATIIWPPSGIALGMLLLHGRALAPGVFLGSFVLNAMVGHSPQELPALREWALAAGVAAGSTLQALAGHALLVRWFGQPIRLRNWLDLLRLLLVAVPSACLVSPTLGVLSLYLLTDLPRGTTALNWLTWWTGDMFGVMVFLPFVLVISNRTALLWRERAVRGLNALSLALLVLPLGLTYIAWKTLADTTYREGQAHFESLAQESEQSMRARLTAYANATRSGAGIFQSSDFVSSDEWHTFIEALRLQKDNPGLLGLGWMEDGVVRYLEPEPLEGVAVGLDLARQPAVRDAAMRAAESGLPAITAPLMLGTDEAVAPGFLLLQPVYLANRRLEDGQQRREALRGFVFSPFQARGLFTDLTATRDRRIDTTLREVGTRGSADEGIPLFTTRVGDFRPRFAQRREIRVFGATWLIEWRSTLEFERAESGRAAYFVLFGGLLFAGLLAVLLLGFGSRPASVQAAGPFRKPLILPLLTFMAVAGSSLVACKLLWDAERAYIGSQVENETRRLETGLEMTARARLQSVRRMAHRWSAGGGTPYVIWRNDARDLVRQVEGLEQLQWIGSDYFIHWSEGNRRGWLPAGGTRADTELSRRLVDSAERGLTYVTEPREVAPGESAFMVYAPVTREARFDGFIAASFDSRGFFSQSAESAGARPFTFVVRHAGHTWFAEGGQPAASAAWTREGNFKVNDRHMTLVVRPTQSFVDGQRTLLPIITLIAGILVAILSGFLVRYVLISRLETARLQSSAQALAESEGRYELALRGMSVGLWDWNITTNAMFLSQRCKDILKANAPGFEPKYTGFLARLHPDDRSRVESALKSHLKRKVPFDTEFRLRRDDGDYVWVHSYGQAQYDEQGFATRMAGSLQDVTSKRQQQHELMSSEARLRSLVENAPVAIAMLDTRMQYLMASRRWLQDYQLEGRDITGKSHYDVFPELRAKPRWLDIHQRALRGECFEIREDSWTRADGQQEWNEWAIHPWLDADGEVGGIVLFTENITDRKLAEAALRASEAMNRAAMDKAPIGKAVIHPDGRFAKVNLALCRMLGFTEEEMLTRDFQCLTHAEDLPALLAHVGDLLEGRVVSFDMEKRCLHRDGRVIWSAISVSAVRRADGSAECLVAQIQDISERRNVDRMKDEFAAVVSNELRAPLAAIRESLGDIAAVRETELPASVRRVIDACRAGCERVGALIDGVVELEKLATGQMRFDFDDECLADITRQVVAADEACARIGLRAIDPEITVYVDRARFARVLSNLLSNAVKFSPPDTTIEVGATLRGEWARVYVRDRGEGVPEEFRARIFGRFAHAHAGGALSGRQASGAGLGLYLARQMVEQMRGAIGFESNTGAGTTFWVEFPRVSRVAQRLSVRSA